MPKKKTEPIEAAEASVEAVKNVGDQDTQSTDHVTENDVVAAVDANGVTIEADAEEIVSDEEMEESSVEITGGIKPSSPTTKERIETPAGRKVRQSRAARSEERARQTAAEQAELTNESALRSAIQRGRVFYGKVASVEEWKVGDYTEIVSVVVLENAFKVIIPFKEMFKNSPINMSTINLETDDGRYEYMRRTRQFAERMIGGDIPFCITAIERDGNDLVMLGSRARAMEQESRRTFGGKNPRYQVGDVVTAKITTVGIHAVVVLIGGVDVVIQQHRLTRRWFLDLHDGYKVGDEIRAVITEVKDDPQTGISVVLDPVRVELDDAHERYNIIKNNGRTKGVITNVIARRNREGNKTGMAIYAYLPSFDLFARVIRVNANSFGRKITMGTQVMLRVIDHADDGYLICEAMYDYGNNSMFNSNMYR